MSLERLARELEETARQTGDMATTITAALERLGNPAPGHEKHQNAAVREIIVALQAQDRIAQRCHNLAHAVRSMKSEATQVSNMKFEQIWQSLKLDELAIPAMSGLPHTTTDGECELF